jgi:CRP/FNR family transcriptional regulator, cyclic AMP receptor protein
MRDYLLLRGLSDETRDALLGLTRRRTYARNEVVFHDGDPADALFLITKGRAAVRVQTPLGDVATLRVLRPGQHFGELALLDPAPRVADIVALEPLEVRVLHVDRFNELRRTNAEVDAVLIDSLVGEVRRLSLALLEALYLPADRRVLRRLVDLCDHYGGSSDSVDVPLTQEQLAELAGTTRSTANRALRPLVESGALQLARGRIVVLDVEKVRAAGR